MANRLRKGLEAQPEKSLPRDALAGVSVALSSVPDGMAGGLLAGVNPIYGLYANVVGPAIGALLVSTPRMIVATTSVTVLVAGQSLDDLAGLDRSSALFLMVVLSGAIQILFGILRFDRATRFVSYSVMIGFLAGVAIRLILSQIPTISGTRASSLDMASPITAAIAFVLATTLRRTRIAQFSTLVAIAAPALLVALLGWNSVELVQDIGRISQGLPSPNWPTWKETLKLLPAALSLATVTLIQGAGVSQNVPMPKGQLRNSARDFIAQGAANLASGSFRGIPVGGSLSTTALSIVAGSTSRWTGVFAGLWMALIVVALPGLVSRVAMPALGALLVLAGIKSIKRSEIAAVWRAGWPARIVIVMSFVATLAFPIHLAVAFSVALSALIHLIKASVDIRIVQLVERPDGRIEERETPRELTGGKPIVLDVYGNLFFAGARTLEPKLPKPGRDKHPIVILRLRGHMEIGATLAEVLADYDEALREADGRLYVTGLTPEVHAHLVGTGSVRLLKATPILGDSTRAAIRHAEAWLIRKASPKSTQRASGRGKR